MFVILYFSKKQSVILTSGNITNNNHIILGVIIEQNP